MKRLDWLDFMKGVAILIVVVGHISHDTGIHYTFNKLIIVCEMPLFFMLSGILAKKATKRTLVRNVVKKIQSLGIPFLVVGGTYAICSKQLKVYLTDEYHLSYWFLLSLLSCWLIFIPLQKGLSYILRNESVSIKKMGEVFYFVPFIVYKLLSKYIPVEVDDLLSLNLTFTYYRFFVVGYFVGLYYKYFRYNIVLWLSAIVTIVMLMLIWIDSSLSHCVPMTIQQLILSVCLSGTIYMVYELCPSFVNKRVVRYGKGSLVIYLFHYMIITYVDWKFVDSGLEIITLMYIILIAMLMSEILLLLTYPIEHNKFLRKYILGKF